MLIANFKQNPELLKDIRSGVLKPTDLASMDVKQLADKTLLEERRKAAAALARDSMFYLTDQGGGSTDMFKCEKCGKRNCSYTQAQTRSADEPMTTFISCLECGHHWKGDDH